MKNIIASIFIAIAAASLTASAAELSDQDRAELRQRAQEFQDQRARNPDFQPGEAADTADRHSKRAKTRTGAKGKKETMTQKAERKARSLEHIPGAFVHRR